MRERAYLSGVTCVPTTAHVHFDIIRLERLALGLRTMTVKGQVSAQ
jgi:hypothetical protein